MDYRDFRFCRQVAQGFSRELVSPIARDDDARIQLAQDEENTGSQDQRADAIAGRARLALALASQEADMQP